MEVIKKSGRKEDFSFDKLSRSVNSASTSTTDNFNISEILTEFRQIVNGKTLITTRQIDIIVYGLLYAKGCTQTLLNYVSYDKK